MGYSKGEQVRLPLRLCGLRAWGVVQTVYHDASFYKLRIDYGNRTWLRKVSLVELTNAEEDYRESRREKQLRNKKLRSYSAKRETDAAAPEK